MCIYIYIHIHIYIHKPYLTLCALKLTSLSLSLALFTHVYFIFGHVYPRPPRQVVEQGQRCFEPVTQARPGEVQTSQVYWYCWERGVALVIDWLYLIEPLYSHKPMVSTSKIWCYEMWWRFLKTSTRIRETESNQFYIDKTHHVSSMASFRNKLNTPRTVT